MAHCREATVLRGIDGRQLDVGQRGDPIEQRRAIRRRLGRDERDSHRSPNFHAALRTFSRQRRGAPRLRRSFPSAQGRDSHRGACTRAPCRRPARGSAPPPRRSTPRPCRPPRARSRAAGGPRVRRAWRRRRCRPGEPSRRASCRSPRGRWRTAAPRRRGRPGRRTSPWPRRRAACRLPLSGRRAESDLLAPETARTASSRSRAEDDVRVDEAAQRETGSTVGERECRVEPRRAVRSRLETGHVLHVELARGFCDVAEQEHLDAECAPALHGAALHGADLALERLRHGEEGQHSSA